jgi:formylglycine-generating enzyme required for sulfatase activity
MKKYLFLVLSSLLLVLFTVTCEKVQVTDLTLNKTSLTLSVGDTGILIVSVLPENATRKGVSWLSDNPAVATIADGVITALSEGTANITVTTFEGNKTASCTLKVNKKVAGEPEMVIIKGGIFPMGCTDNECWGDGREEPVHLVTVSNFQISKYPITQKQWKAIMGNNPSYFKGCDDCPVEMVTWEDAQEFIAKLNAATGKNYRLPTEAEWEFAARGGNKSRGYKYSGSNDIDAVAWHVDNSEKKTHPVGTKAPNELGIYDMSGNVWEWCNDWYGSYSANEQVDPQGPPERNYRVGRGGSWSAAAQYCRLSYRSNLPKNYSSIYLSFRVVLSI